MFTNIVNQISKLLNSGGDLMRSMNTILIMLQEVMPVRNPQLLIRDNVINKYFIDLAPEISETDRKKWNQRSKDERTPPALKHSHGMVLYPGDVDILGLPMPRDLLRDKVTRIYQPVIYKQSNLPLCFLAGVVVGHERINEIQNILRFLADILAITMVARGYPTTEIKESTRETADAPTAIDNIVGQSEPLKRIAETIRKIATSKATVLIRGESGTGKELIAAAIHNNSLHRKAPFIGVNCAALSDNLLESELFGHEKGAFTGATNARKGRFELADGGTLFLDEIGDTSLGFQAKILRVLQEGQFERLGGTQTLHVNVRIVCATNVDLEEAIQTGRFREDLFYRLNVITIPVPPLRERREDIPLLVRYYLRRFNQQENRSIMIKDEDMDFLCSLDWPGNVRELENCIHSAFLMEHDGFINLSQKRSASRGRRPPLRQPMAQIPRMSNLASSLYQPPLEAPKSTVVQEEIKAIEDALTEARGVQVKAAELLGISLRQLRYRIQKYNLMVRKIHR